MAMMLLVAAITGTGLSIAQRRLRASAEAEIEGEFRARQDAWRRIQDARREMLKELAGTLARKPRIHAALEDNALDLLYASARDELRDGLGGRDGRTRIPRARFYRFLGADGHVIPATEPDVGTLSAEEEARLALPGAPHEQQLGYLVRDASPEGDALDEVISVPIFSSETGEPIATLALGFPPGDPAGPDRAAGIRSGVWVEGSLHLSGLPAGDRRAIEEVLASLARAPGASATRTRIMIGGAPALLLHRLLNPGSPYAAAYDVFLFPLAELAGRERELRWSILAAAALMLLLGLAGSHYAAARLSKPVEQLAVQSVENLEGRRRAESELEQTAVELQRVARFSSDASHQLKTPVAVLRAGLDELLAREPLTPEGREEVSILIHQTHRLGGLIDDLLLLARMDAGRLRLDLRPVRLAELLDPILDDLSAQSEGMDLAVEAEVPPGLTVAAEPRYTGMIVQNLVENARKYNQPGGRIRIAARSEGPRVVLAVGNTGPAIPAAAQPHIFDRFHRGAAGENVPGHGLGLNLARELARLHGGDLVLVSSTEGWTAFELQLRSGAAAGAGPA